jgi:hypothetical protein
MQLWLGGDSIYSYVSNKFIKVEVIIIIIILIVMIKVEGTLINLIVMTIIIR